jgi:flagellar hook assembly protein FlgD
MRVGIFDVAGALVARLADEEVGPGARSFHWDLRDEHGRRVPAGFYAVRVVTERGTETRPFVVSR